MLSVEKLVEEVWGEIAQEPIFECSVPVPVDTFRSSTMIYTKACVLSLNTTQWVIALGYSDHRVSCGLAAVSIGFCYFSDEDQIEHKVIRTLESGNFIANSLIYGRTDTGELFVSYESRIQCEFLLQQLPRQKIQEFVALVSNPIWTYSDQNFVITLQKQTILYRENFVPLLRDALLRTLCA
ncbi:hypothetical protein J7K05_01105 [bacterium]|nr:hypothetical protein [bacterium]